jgi:hypothetical protein
MIFAALSHSEKRGEDEKFGLRRRKFCEFVAEFGAAKWKLPQTTFFFLKLKLLY